MSEPRALWLTNDLPPRSGGIEQFVGNLLARGDPATTRVLAPDVHCAAEHDATLAYEVRRSGRRPLLPTPALARRLRQEAAAHGADVVVFAAAWPLGELAGALPVPAVALSHGHEAGMARVGGGPLVRRAVRSLSALGVISRYTAAALQPWVPPGVRVAWLPPGVDTEAFSPATTGAGVRHRHGIPSGAPLVVCVSRLVARKGQDVLLAAWPGVRARVPEAWLLLAGAGPQASALSAQAAGLGAGSQVVVAGEVAWDRLPAYHAAADVFAMPCRTRWRGLDVEGLGIVYLEAQASGVAVVAGSSGGAPEAVVAGRTGLVVDGRSIASVTRAVSELLADPHRRGEMGRAGRAFVERHHAWPVIARRLRAVMAAAAATGPPNRRSLRAMDSPPAPATSADDPGPR